MLRVGGIDANVKRLIDVIDPVVVGRDLADSLPTCTRVGALEQASLGGIERRGAPVDRRRLTGIERNPLGDHGLIRSLVGNVIRGRNVRPFARLELGSTSGKTRAHRNRAIGLHRGTASSGPCAAAPAVSSGRARGAGGTAVRATSVAHSGWVVADAAGVGRAAANLTAGA